MCLWSKRLPKKSLILLIKDALFLTFWSFWSDLNRPWCYPLVFGLLCLILALWPLKSWAFGARRDSIWMREWRAAFHSGEVMNKHRNAKILALNILHQNYSNQQRFKFVMTQERRWEDCPWAQFLNNLWVPCHILQSDLNTVNGSTVVIRSAEVTSILHDVMIG